MLFLSYNFFNKIFANFLFFVKATYFTGTTSQTFRFLFPTMIALSFISETTYKKYVSKQEISIGRWPVHNDPSVAIRPSVCAVVKLFLYILNDLVVLYFT